MMTIIVLLVYIVGVYMAYFQIQRWAGHKLGDWDEYEAVFTFSLFSWLVYPIYGVVWLINKSQEE